MAKKESHVHVCYDCKMANIVKYTGDPLIAECKLTGDKNLAQTHINCSSFLQRTAEVVIEHRKKRLGLTDIYI